MPSPMSTTAASSRSSANSGHASCACSGSKGLNVRVTSCAQPVEAELPCGVGVDLAFRLLGQTVAEPCVHHGLLHEDRRAMDVGNVDCSRVACCGDEVVQQAGL